LHLKMIAVPLLIPKDYSVNERSRVLKLDARDLLLSCCLASKTEQSDSPILANSKDYTANNHNEKPPSETFPEFRLVPGGMGKAYTAPL